MIEPMNSTLFMRVDVFERRACLAVNRASRSISIRRFFAVVSRVGDGVVWYVLMLAMPIARGRAGLSALIEMAAAGGLGLVVYKLLKQKLVRERPYVLYAGIECGAAPLDRYSFPSGHTLHAVLFTTVAVAWVPGLAFVLVPLTALIALSRVVLGLHYPSDVLAGGALGGAIGWIANLVAGV
jgi:undecaprenyl-diphosphatase